MYKRSLLISVVALIIAACSSNEPAQNSELILNCESVKVTPGIWEKTKVTPEAKQAALIAVTSLEGSHSIKKIFSVQEQVVAGKNYDIIFSIENNVTYEAKVFRNSQGRYRILSIQPISLVDITFKNLCAE